MTTGVPILRVDTPCKIPSEGREEPDVGFARLDIAKLKVQKTSIPRPIPDVKTLGFGGAYTDHMAFAVFDPKTGWSSPEITPLAPLTLDPSSSCLQYGTGVFEGMKAYLGQDGKVRLFRPELNMRRLERSAARLALPAVDGDAVLEMIKRLVAIDKRWIPTEPGCSLYFRPTVIGTTTTLGIVPSERARLYIIATPTGPYFSRPITLLPVSTMVRAWPGGTGGHKACGNYAPTFLAHRSAVDAGYSQALWLFEKAGEAWVTEGSGMNIFAVIDREDGKGWDVITPPLDGTILPGITRASCLTLLSDPAFVATAAIPVSASQTKTDIENGMTTEADSWIPTLHPAERAFSMSDLARWSAGGMIREVFCVGTAVIVCAVHRIGFEGHGDLDVRPTNVEADPLGLGPVGRALKEWLLGVQTGRIEYRGWGVVVCE